MSGSDDLDRAVIIAMIAMRMMQASVNQIIGMMAMWHSLVPAIGTVDVIGIMAGAAAGAGIGIGGADLNHMLVDMILMRVMQMTVMQVIDMIAMAHRGMTAILAMLMRMVVMDGAVMCHGGSCSVQWSSQA